MYRTAITKLIEWKNDPKRKPLLLLGARQVGKTWLMNEFGRLHFKNVVFIRFDRNPQMHAVFNQDYDLQRIIMALQIEAGFQITPQDTLLIFDEIQTCPAALTSLKYFCEDAREYFIIAAGSLLGIGDQQGTGFPVGKVDRIYLYPMTFTEFLDATGNHGLLELLRQRNWSMIEVFQNKFIDLLRYYYFVGGMPEAVATFVETKDFNKVRKIQKALLADYLDDFGKHAQPALKSQIEMIWDSIPAQLAKENKKFIYSKVASRMSKESLDPAMCWLLDAGLTTHTQRVAKPSFPLISYTDTAFKAFFLDVGLLTAKANLSQHVLIEGNRIFQEFKGALTEQYVLQQLIAELSLIPYYWSNTNGQAEIDFLIEADDHIIPIEAKAERNLQAKSLKSYCQKFTPPIAVRTSMNHYYRQRVINQNESTYEYTLIDIPLYGISQILAESRQAE